MSIEKLLIKQAQLSDLRRALRAEGCMESARCTQMQDDSADGFPLRVGRSCIEDVYQGWKDCFDENPWGEPGFEEVWAEAVHEGDVCRHCQNVRVLKKQRIQTGRSLAGVRAAITRVGRRLAREEENAKV